MAHNQGWRASFNRHDDTCSSDNDISNVKGTQICASESSNTISGVDALLEKDGDPSTTHPINTHSRNLSFPIDGGASNVHQGFWGAALQPTSLQVPASIRHRYIMESTVTRSPAINSPSSNDTCDRNLSPVDQNFSSRRTTLENDAMESILSDLNMRFCNSEDIHQELERKLLMKNQQLSQNTLLLAESRENISKLQYQLDGERREKQELKDKLKQLITKGNELERLKTDNDEALKTLQQETYQIDHQLREKNMVCTSLRQQLEELKMSKQVIAEESELLTNQLREEKKAAEEIIANLNNQMSDQSVQINQLQEVCNREEKSRKCAEKEIALVTQQGQSLIEQQSLMRTQYQEDLEVHKSRIAMLEKLAMEKESQILALQNQIEYQQQETRNVEQAFTEKVEEVKNHYELQLHSSGIEKTQLKGQLDIQSINTEQFVQNIQSLKEELAITENKLRSEQESNAAQQEHHKQQLDGLLSKHNKEREEWQQLHDEQATNARASLESKTSELEATKKSFTKENLDLKCMIAELEDRLEKREKNLTSLKDKIQALTLAKDATSSEINELQSKLSEDQKLHESRIDKKDAEIATLKESVHKLEEKLIESAQISNKEREQLEGQVRELQSKNNELNERLEEQEEILATLRRSQREASGSMGKIANLRAIISKKESSKAILAAEQQRIEKDYSAVLSQKTSEINLLEQEIKNLQQENAVLKGIKEKSSGVNKQDIIHHRNVSCVTIGTETDADGNLHGLLAKQESSKQILAAENVKIKEELKTAKTWWNRDVNELQRRNMAQANTLCHLERKMTSLETENIHLKRVSDGEDLVITPSQISSLSGRGPHSLEGEELLSQYRRELVAKDNQIQNLEESLKAARAETKAALSKLELASEQEKVLRQSLEGKMSQNEMDVQRIQQNLTEAEMSLDMKDHETAQALVKQSSTDVYELLANIKDANISATDTLQLAADTQSNLIELHSQFSKILERIESEAKSSRRQQRTDKEASERRHKQHVQKLNEDLQLLIAETKFKSQKHASLTAENTNLSVSLQKAEHKLRDMEVHAANAHQDLEIAQMAKTMADNKVDELEKIIESSRIKLAEVESRYRLLKTDEVVARERDMVELKSKQENRIAKIEEIHKQNFDNVVERLKLSENSNAKLIAEIAELNGKSHKGYRSAEEEIRSLHGEVQKLTVEKSEMQERFQESLSSLRGDHDLILKERRQEIKTLQTQIAQLESRLQAVQNEYETCKTSSRTLEIEKQKLKIEYTNEIHQIKEELANTKQQLCELKEKSEIDKKHLANTLTAITKLEIESLKLKKQLEQELKRQNEISVQYKTEKECFKSTLNDKVSENKQLHDDNKHLRMSLNRLEADINLQIEQNQMAKQDHRHLESVIELYKNKLESARKLSESAISGQGKEMQECASMDPAILSRSLRYRSQSVENDNELGVKTAQLTNKVAEQQKANLYIKQQLDHAEEKYQELVNANVKQKESIGMITQKYEESLQTINKLRNDLQVSQKELNTQKSKTEHTEEILKKTKSAKSTVEKENDCLQKKFEELEMQKDLVRTEKIASEEQLTRYNEELQHKLSRTRRQSLHTEQSHQSQISLLQKDTSILKQQLDDALEANKSLVRYIKNIKMSFFHIFDEEDTLVTANTRQNSKTPSFGPRKSSTGKSDNSS